MQRQKTGAVCATITRKRAANSKKDRKMNRDELILEKKCRELARSRGWVCCKLEKNGNKGIPDDLFISPNQKCILIEFKKDDKQKPRPEQTLWLCRFSKIAYLVGTFERFDEIVKETEKK